MSLPRDPTDLAAQHHLLAPLCIQLARAGSALSGWVPPARLKGLSGKHPRPAAVDLSDRVASVTAHPAVMLSHMFGWIDCLWRRQRPGTEYEPAHRLI